MTPPTLHTDRLTLRAPTLDDLGAYRAFYDATDVRVGKYRGGRSADEIAGILLEDIDHWQAKSFGMWVLRDKASSKVVGGAGLAHPDDWPRHELTWWLMPDARGNGLATEASKAVIAWAYDDQGWPVVETHMRDENTAAHRLAERLGGVKSHRQAFTDGIERDVYVLPRGGLT